MSEWAGALDQALMRGREELIARRSLQSHHLITNFATAVRGGDGEGEGDDDDEERVCEGFLIERSTRDALSL